MAEKRHLSDADPDYEDYEDGTNIETTERKQQRLLEKDVQESTIHKIKRIIHKEFDTEIAAKRTEIHNADKTLIEAQRRLDCLRACIVASYYSQAAQGSSKSRSILPQHQPTQSIHPAVKKFLGKSVPCNALASSSDHFRTEEETNVKAQSEKNAAENLLGQKAGESFEKSLEVKIDDNVSENTRKFSNRRCWVKEKKRIIVGNVSKYIPIEKRDENDQATHKWMVYVRGPKDAPNVNDFVNKVWFFLHPSYRPNDLVEISEPPFHLTRRGWGEFPIRVQLHFKDQRNKRIDIIHNLKLDRTYTGIQTLGAETVADIELEKELIEKTSIVLKSPNKTMVTHAKTPNLPELDPSLAQGITIAHDVVLDKETSQGPLLASLFAQHQKKCERKQSESEGDSPNKKGSEDVSIGAQKISNSNNTSIKSIVNSERVKSIKPIHETENSISKVAEEILNSSPKKPEAEVNNVPDLPSAVFSTPPGSNSFCSIKESTFSIDSLPSTPDSLNSTSTSSARETPVNNKSKQRDTISHGKATSHNIEKDCFEANEDKSHFSNKESKTMSNLPIMKISTNLSEKLGATKKCSVGNATVNADSVTQSVNTDVKLKQAGEKSTTTYVKMLDDRGRTILVPENLVTQLKLSSNNTIALSSIKPNSNLGKPGSTVSLKATTSPKSNTFSTSEKSAANYITAISASKSNTAIELSAVGTKQNCSGKQGIQCVKPVTKVNAVSADKLVLVQNKGCNVTVVTSSNMQLSLPSNVTSATLSKQTRLATSKNVILTSNVKQPVSKKLNLNQKLPQVMIRTASGALKPLGNVIPNASILNQINHLNQRPTLVNNSGNKSTSMLPANLIAIPNANLGLKLSSPSTFSSSISAKSTLHTSLPTVTASTVQNTTSLLKPVLNSVNSPPNAGVKVIQPVTCSSNVNTANYIFRNQTPTVRELLEKQRSSKVLTAKGVGIGTSVTSNVPVGGISLLRPIVPNQQVNSQSVLIGISPNNVKVQSGPSAQRPLSINNPVKLENQSNLKVTAAIDKRKEAQGFQPNKVKSLLKNPPVEFKVPPQLSLLPSVQVISPVDTSLFHSPPAKRFRFEEPVKKKKQIVLMRDPNKEPAPDSQMKHKNLQCKLATRKPQSNTQFESKTSSIVEIKEEIQSVHSTTDIETEPLDTSLPSTMSLSTTPDSIDMEEEDQPYIYHWKDLVRLQNERNAQKFADIPHFKPKDFIHFEDILRRVMRYFPLVQKDADKSIHPYCADSVDTFLNWNLGKRRAAELTRVAFMLRKLSELVSDEDIQMKDFIWSKKRIMIWCRSHGYTPLDMGVSGMRGSPEGTSLKSYNSYSDYTSVLNNLLHEGSINTQLYSDRSYKKSGLCFDEDLDVDIISIDNSRRITSTVFPFTIKKEAVLEDIILPAGECVPFVQDICSQIGVSFEPCVIGEESGATVRAHLVQELLFQASMRLASDLLREAFSVKFTNSLDSNEISSSEVYQAINQLSYCDFLSNSKFGLKDENF